MARPYQVGAKYHWFFQVNDNLGPLVSNMLLVVLSDVPAQLDLKATALVRFSMAQAFKIHRPGQSHQ